jgi:hypothetical protein
MAEASISQNEPFEPNTDAKNPGKKWGAYEEDTEEPIEQKLAREDGSGRAKPLEMMSQATNESAVHPNSSGDA